MIYYILLTIITMIYKNKSMTWSTGAKYILRLKTSDIRMVKETIVGIGDLGKNLSRVGRTESPMCQNYEMAVVKTRRYLLEQWPATISHWPDIFYSIEAKLADTVRAGRVRQLQKCMVRVRRPIPSTTPNKHSSFWGVEPMGLLRPETQSLFMIAFQD